MKPEAVYALLVEANPVPDADIVADLRDARSNEMPTQTAEKANTDTTVPARPRTRPRTRWLIAAAAVLVAIVVIGVMVADGDGDEGSVATNPEPGEGVVGDPEVSDLTAEEGAVSVVRTFEAAIASGDIDTVIAMSQPDLTNAVQDRPMWEMNAIHTAAWPRTVGDCETDDSFGGAVSVTCELSFSDPVAGALGISDVTAPYRVFEDGTVAWEPWQPEAVVAELNRAYADYLVEFHFDEYEAVCFRGAYEPGTVATNGGLALTPECAELWVPLAGEVAAWVEMDN